MSDATYKAGWGYDTYNMRKALGHEGRQLSMRREALMQELDDLEQAEKDMTKAFEGLDILDKNDVAAMEPTEEHVNYIDFLCWVAKQPDLQFNVKD